MYQVYNVLTNQPEPVLSDTPYVLAGPLAGRKTKQKVDEQGNLLYLSQTEILDEEGNGTGIFAETTDAYKGYIKETWDDELQDYVEEVVDEPYPPVIVDDGAVYEWREIIPTPAEIAQQIQTELTNAVQAHLDNTAKQKGYDGILSAASYAALPVGEPFQAEGVAYALWRSAVWVKCYEVLGDVMAGTRGIPTVGELLAELPVLQGV